MTLFLTDGYRDLPPRNNRVRCSSTSCAGSRCCTGLIPATTSCFERIVQVEAELRGSTASGHHDTGHPDCRGAG